MVASSDETPDVVYDDDSLHIAVQVGDETMLRKRGFESLKRHIVHNLVRAHPKDVYFLAYRDESDGVVSIQMTVHNVSELKSIERTEFFLQDIVDTYDCRKAVMSRGVVTR